jgi:hypothetical protein
MYLQGSIQRFNLATVLQFLAQSSCVGVLEVRDFEEYGFIYLVEGRVQAISLPVTDEKLGSRLIKAGLLTEEQLAQALLADTQMTKEQKKAMPLGQRLIERGFTNEAQIREIMAKQTMDQVFELAHWQNGMFIYDEPERMPNFQIAIQGNVQELLLDAYRRIDEGEESKKGKSAIEDEVCFACPVEDDCTDDIKAKYRKNDVCLWRDMGAVIDDRYDKVRDARQMYKSKEAADGASLDAEL